MIEGSDEVIRVPVTVRYFAAARAAAGADSEIITVRPGATLAELVGYLADRDVRLATALSRCSYLCDGVAVRDDSTVLRAGDIIDVLPPFAGG